MTTATTFATKAREVDARLNRLEAAQQGQLQDKRFMIRIPSEWFELLDQAAAEEEALQTVTRTGPKSKRSEFVRQLIQDALAERGYISQEGIAHYETEQRPAK